MAAKQNVSVFSITDHDATEAFEQIKIVPDNMLYVPGIEITTTILGKRHHYLAYFPFNTKGKFPFSLQIGDNKLTIQ